MASGYWVDWHDSAYPKIKPISSAYPGTTPMTLKEAKAEIINHARNQRQHWLSIIHMTQQARAYKIEEKGSHY